VRVTRLVAVALFAALVSGCFAESGLRDEFREATRALDDLVEQIDDEPIREAADRARDTVDEAQAALEAFREDPSAETRQALEDAERRLNDSRDTLERLIERAPEQVRGALGEVVDALERIRREIRQELED
jgi:ABC-type transporter Mla subunit MlaD